MSSVPNMSVIINECVPLFRRMAIGRYAVSIGGSHGKGTSDQHSDIDFRLFCDDLLPDSEEKTEIRKQIHDVIAKWKTQGIEIDGCWMRKVSDVDEKLNDWLEGRINFTNPVWTIWGYQLLTDINNQQVIDDSFNIIAQWKERLKHYPASLKKAILDKHMGSLRYWRKDYHYANKVRRKDTVFLASLSARLVNDLIQVIFALNNTYYVGDGSNLKFIREFDCKPIEFEDRVKSALYPGLSEDMYEKQREILIGLIDDVEKIIE